MADTADNPPLTDHTHDGTIACRQERDTECCWTEEIEAHLADWADHAKCYRWLHDRAQIKFKMFTIALTAPVVLITAATGAAGFAVGGFDVCTAVGGMITGALSVIATLLTAAASYMRVAETCEGHRHASLGWGKLNRSIAAELMMSPSNRASAHYFVRVVREETERLASLSPDIPDSVVRSFELNFAGVRGLARPEQANDLRATIRPHHHAAAHVTMGTAEGETQRHL